MLVTPMPGEVESGQSLGFTGQPAQLVQGTSPSPSERHSQKTKQMTVLKNNVRGSPLSSIHLYTGVPVHTQKRKAYFDSSDVCPPDFQPVTRQHIMVGVHGRGTGSRDQNPSVSFKCMPQVTQLPSAGPQLLKVLWLPSHATSCEPSFQHVGLWQTFKI